MDKRAATRAVLALFSRTIQPEEVSATRGIYFGGAGACLAIVLLVAQLQAKSLAVEISLAAAAMALPLWISLGFGAHFWRVLNLRYSDFAESDDLVRAVGWAGGVAYLLLIVSVFALVFWLSLAAGVLFAAAAIGSGFAIRRAIGLGVLKAFEKERLAAESETREAPQD